MQDKHREQRRQKRQQKQKKRREDLSRPGTGGPTQRIEVSKGREWPVGECYATLDWDEPGARVDLVVSRARPDGLSVAAIFELDRSGPGLVSARTIGGLRQEHVAGESGRISERTGRSMVEIAPGLVAALVDDAREHGTNPAPPAFAEAAGLLDGIERREIGVPFGAPGHGGSGSDPAPPEESPPPKEGLLGGLKKRLFG